MGLTDAVGMPLFEIIAKQLYFTSAGTELAATATSILQEWVLFEQQLQRSKGLTKGTLKLAVVSTTKYFIPRMLGTFCANYPDIDVSLEVLHRDGVIQRLQHNLEDFYIMSMPPEDIEIEDEIFMTNHLVMIASIDNPLSTNSTLRLPDLRHERFILREIGSGSRMATDIYFKQQKFVPNIRMELGSNEAIKQAVAGGLGIAVLSIHALGLHADSEGVSVLNVEGLPIPSNWHIVNLKGKKLSPLARTFHDHVLCEANKIELPFK